MTDEPQGVKGRTGEGVKGGIPPVAPPAGPPEPPRTGDPESGQPNPIPVATLAAEVASEPPRGATTGARVLSAILPGAGHFLVGAPVRGLWFLFFWGLLLAVVFFARARIFALPIALPRGVALDDYIATATLAL